MLTIILVNSLVVIIAVAIHYEFLNRLSAFMLNVKVKHRSRVILGVFGALIAHIMEVWVFAFAYYFKHGSETWGSLEGNFDGSLIDSAYFSFTTYTTLGFGDIIPHGDIRYLTGIESLTGLVLITWTASFLFLEMQKNWYLK